MLSLLNPSRRECDLSDRIAQIPLRFEIRCRVMSTDAARFLPSICRQNLSAYSVTFSSEFYQSSDIINSNASSLTADKICNLAVLDRLCLTTACRIYRFSMKISIHPLTADPTAAWHELCQHQKVVKITAKVPTTEAPSDKLRVVCMSDTHSLTPYIKFDIPMGDVFIHAGDFTKCGSLQEVIEFNNWIGNLPHKHKIIIAGNHELSFDPTFTNPFSVHTSGDHQKHTGTSILDNIPTLGMSKDALAEAIKTTNIKDYLTNCTYLEDSEITVHGIKIYGTPWQPEFCKWAFNVPRGEACLSKWEMIPSDTDILVTHTPPVGHGDLCCTGVRAGCVELLSTVQNRVKPKYHVFGHIHEGYGISSDGKIIYINASTCDLNYLPNNPPIVFDITLPSGIQKS